MRLELSDDQKFIYLVDIFDNSQKNLRMLTWNVKDLI